MTDAKCKEIRGLLQRGNFKVILREEVSPDANILPGRFSLAIKSTKDDQIKFKARHVFGSHRYKLKHMILHNTSTLQPQSIWIIIALAAAYGLNL